MIPQLNDELWFPEADSSGSTLFGPPGLVAMGGDLSVPRLLLAYRSGIFPWSDDPLTWWSPDPRAILELACLHIPRSLNRELRQNQFRVTHNTAFAKVVGSCAATNPRRPRTWISPGFIEAYTRLHREGWAHSVECWAGHNLVGGLYGIAIGGLFAGESMFHLRPNASKVALVRTVEHLTARGFGLFDLQMLTPVTRLLGATEIPRSEYLARLREALHLPSSFGEPERHSVMAADEVKQTTKAGGDQATNDHSRQ